MSEANGREIMFWLRPKAAPCNSWFNNSFVFLTVDLAEIRTVNLMRNLNRLGRLNLKVCLILVVVLVVMGEAPLR